ncbi:MAG: Bax inhibitor-1 family protein [Kiloniellaceae bacterium]
MALRPDRRYMTRAQAEAAVVDVGLRRYMLRVYNYMSVALALTGAVAFFVSTSPALMQAIYGTPLLWVVILAPLGMVFFLAARIHRMSTGTAQAMFWAYAGLVGLSLASIFLVYTGASIARVFFITAGAFAGLSLVGYTTKKDLSGMGSFLFMGVIGLILAMVVNWFLASSALQLMISVGGVLIFAGLTAYDTQQIKVMYSEGDSSEVGEKKAIIGALKLYLDFLNMFIFLLHIVGVARE